MSLLSSRPAARWVLTLLVVFLAPAAVAQQRDALPARPAAPRAPQPKQRYWTTDWSFQDIDVDQLFSRLESIGLEIPIDADGDVSTEFRVSVPWTSLRDAKAYRFSGKISSTRLRLENLLLENFAADLQYDNGVLTLQRLSGRWTDQRAAAGAKQPEGTFVGDASLQLVPSGDFQANLRTKSLPLGPLHNLFVSAKGQSDAKPLDGLVSGELHFKAPLNQLRQITQWTADADLMIENFRVGDTVPLSLDSGPIQIRRGIILAQGAELSSPASPDIRMELAAQFELIGQQRFQFRIRGNDLPLNTFGKLVIPDLDAADGKLDLEAIGRGELAAQTWSISGRVGSPSLMLMAQNLGRLEHEFQFDQQRFTLHAINRNAAAGEDTVLVKEISAEYKLDADALTVSSLQAKVFGGTVQGTAKLARNESLGHQLTLSWQNLQPVIRVPLIAQVHGKLSAVSSGHLDWSVPSGSFDQPAKHQGVARVDLNQISVGDASIGELSINLRAGDGEIQLGGEGTLFGGSFQVETTAEASLDDSWQSLLSRPPRGQVNAKSMKLDQILAAVRPTDRRRWTGNVSTLIDWDTAIDAGNEIRPAMTLSVSGLAIDGQRVARNLTARLRLRGETVTIDRAQGRFARGRLTADGTWSIGRGGKGQIQVRISDVDASDALLPISRQASKSADGRVSGTLTIASGDPLRVRGAVTLRNSSFFSVPTGRVNTGLVASISPDLRRWRVALPSIQGELAGGRIQGDASLSSSLMRAAAFDLTSRWSMKKVDFGTLLADVGASSSYAHGRITGQLDLGGRGIRSAKDLSGQFEANLDATQAGAIPGLLKADRFLGIVSLGGVQFDEGHVKGMIHGGAAKISEFWLRADRVRVWAEGLVQLESKRMDLGVVLSTGNFSLAEAQLLAFASQLAIQSVAPVATLLEINRLVSNRTIYFDLYGPLGDPHIRLKPLEIIREQAARFLLRELLVAASAASNSAISN